MNDIARIFEAANPEHPFMADIMSEHDDDTCHMCGGEGGYHDDWGQPHICRTCEGSGSIDIRLYAEIPCDHDWVAVVEAQMRDVA